MQSASGMIIRQYVYMSPTSWDGALRLRIKHRMTKSSLSSCVRRLQNVSFLLQRIHQQVQLALLFAAAHIEVTT